MKPSILITDGDQRAALAAVRSLGRAGYRVVVTSPRGRSLAGGSRYAAAEFVVPDPLSAADAFVAAIRAIVAEQQVTTLIPIAEPALLTLLPLADTFDGVRIPFASAESFRHICDKGEVARVAAEVGIGVPRQRRLDHPSDADLLTEKTLAFPLVLKPTRSVVGEGEDRQKVSVIHVADRKQLVAALERLPQSAFPILAQERIVGPGVGVFLLMQGGEPVAAFAHRRLREKPPSGGVSVLRESIPLDPQLLDRCVELLRRFDWEGVAMIECKVSAATGIPYIMEINGRFWGSLQLAIDAGVDFPRLLVEGTNGSGPVTEYTNGVRLRWELGDLDHLIARMRRSPEELALPPGSPSRGRALLDFFTGFLPVNRQEIFRLNDPAPFLRESVAWLRGR